MPQGMTIQAHHDAGTVHFYGDSGDVPPMRLATFASPVFVKELDHVLAFTAKDELHTIYYPSPRVSR